MVASTKIVHRKRALTNVVATRFPACADTCNFHVSSVRTRAMRETRSRRRALPPTRERVITVKRHRGEPGHTRAHAGTRITQTNLTTIHPNPTTHPHDHATAETAADSTAARTAAGPESTAPRGRLRRGRPQRTRPCLHPLPERRAPPRACSKAVGEKKARAADA